MYDPNERKELNFDDLDIPYDGRKRAPAYRGDEIDYDDDEDDRQGEGD